MLSIKARDITKCVIVAIIASLLCAYIFLPLSLLLLLQPILAIDTAGVTHSHARALLIIYGSEAAGAINYGISGLLMGVLIGFVLKNNRMFATTLSLLIVTIVIIVTSLVLISNFSQDSKSEILIRLGLSFLLHMVFFWGCGFLGVWFFVRRNHKAGRQSLPGDDSPKAMPQQ